MCKILNIATNHGSILFTPSILLVSAEGKVVEGMGFSRDLPKRLKKAIETMSEEKTIVQAEEELPQKSVDKSVDEKRGKPHFNIGKPVSG